MEREMDVDYDVEDGRQEDGVEIPLERIAPETLRNLIGEFVTRQWDEWGEAGCTLDDKIAQVLQQLQERKAKVVFDLKSNSANIVVSR
jgi:uncharacterized protein YheU (UPF0270 family)